MVRRRQRERSLFEVLLPDGQKLWPDWLRRIDTLLEDEAGNGNAGSVTGSGGAVGRWWYAGSPLASSKPSKASVD